jgi:hypothetical protein
MTFMRTIVCVSNMGLGCTVSIVQLVVKLNLTVNEIFLDCVHEVTFVGEI